VGHGNRDFTSDWGYHKSNMIYAQNVNVDFSTSSQANRRLGVGINKDEQFVYTNDMTCNLSFDFYFCSYPRVGNKGDDVYSFLFDSEEYQGGYLVGNASGTNYFPIKVGGNFYNKCYLDTVNIDITPFQPVKGRVSFKCYQPPEVSPTKEDSLVPFDSYDEWLNGDDVIASYHCELSGVFDEVVSSDVISKISYSKNYRRTPVYTVNDIKPSSFLMDSIEAKINIESTGLSELFNYSGSRTSDNIGVRILNASGSGILDTYNGGYDVVIGSGAAVNNQSYSINEGDGIASRVDIQEIIL
jgi:hypothetical protein